MKIKLLSILLIFGSMHLNAEWSIQKLNPFRKKWYEDCNSERMIKSYPNALKMMFRDKFGDKVRFEYVNINSKPIEVIDKPKLICKVNLSYKVALGMDYTYGTADLHVEVESYDSEKDILNATFTITNENVRNGNMLNDIIRHSLH